MTKISNTLENAARALTRWAEKWAGKWFPDAYVFAALMVIIVTFGALFIGVPIKQVGIAFGDGYWSFIPFTMQMVMVAISGFALSASPVATKLIVQLAKLPKTGRSAVAFVALISIMTSLISWAISLVFSGLLVRALARRTDMRLDYRAAGAAAYLGLGSTWSLGLSSSAAQLQGNPASLPPDLFAITGILPFSQTIFLPQSMLLTFILMVTSIGIAYYSTPPDKFATTARDISVSLSDSPIITMSTRPSDCLERSPMLTILIVALGAIWIWYEVSRNGPLVLFTNLNTYNFLLLLLAMLCNWQPHLFLRAVEKAVPSIAAVLIQFPLYGGIAFILTKAGAADGATLSHHLAQFFVDISSHSSFPSVIGIYSAVLGFFVPSGGGKWIIEAPYVMQAAIDLKVHLGWAVTVYNAAEALPNLINPFWMLPLLGILRLQARDIVGYTFVQFVVHVPLVIFLLWMLAGTLTYLPPVFP